jgi:diguanylate cyclase (GGDEF)-like protein
MLDPELLSPMSLARALRLESARAKREGTVAHGVLVELDDFHLVAGWCGEDVVVAVGARLMGALRATDLLGRLPDDRFLVLLPGGSHAEARRVAERLRRALTEAPFPVGDDQVHLTATLGVAKIGPETEHLEDLLAAAESAVTRGKEAGKNRVATSGRRGRSATNLSSIEALLEGDEPLRVVRQALYAVVDEHVCGYELLVRGPRGPLERPTALFAAAARADLLSTLDLRCVKAMAAALYGLTSGQRAQLNLLPSTLVGTPVDRLLSILPSRMLCIEVSEQELVGDPAELATAINELREGGMEIALDDVGFSRSSLEALMILQPDAVKLGRRQIAGIGTDPGRQRELARLVAAVRPACPQIVAVGVETRADLAVVRDLGIPYAQGYLWDRPT